MTAIEIARRMSQLGETADACAAYGLVLGADDAQPAERLEASCYLLEHGADPRISMSAMVRLHQEGFFAEDIFRILDMMFYQPQRAAFRKRYEANCKVLSNYPYLFRKDFLPFEELPVRFLPYDNQSKYVPYSVAGERFDPLVNVRDTVISRNFFRDLEKPVLADDVYSQYELEYLRDNVRLSEHIGRENHVYLHYADWGTFCSWLQTLDFRSLLKKKQFVFLIGDETGRYPMDFGVDYSKYPLRRVRIREVKRLIWHAQLSSSNGGDFFNEIFDAHPNLYYASSIMYYSFEEVVEQVKEQLQASSSLDAALKRLKIWNDPWLVRELYNLENRTDADILIAIFMQRTRQLGTLDEASRIVPAMFCQPHFHNVESSIHVSEKGEAVLDTNVYDKIHASTFLNGFPYVKTFLPLRRFTTSYGSTLKFMEAQLVKNDNITDETTKTVVMPDLQIQRVLNRTYLRNPDDRLFRDSVIVRFEDGKINPQATFSKLAEFLDIPYTETMTYCSRDTERNVKTQGSNVIGFDLTTVYRTHSGYLTDADRCFIEYFMRDAYQYYGYDFQTYDGSPVDEEQIKEWMRHFDRLDKDMEDSWRLVFQRRISVTGEDPDKATEIASVAAQKMLDDFLAKRDEKRLLVAETLQRGLRFINKRGQPLEMTPLLQPDPALLVQPLYH